MLVIAQPATKGTQIQCQLMKSAKMTHLCHCY